MAKKARRLALLALSLSVWSLFAASPRVLFPANLHLTRQIEDPISASTITIEQYCAGNRIVAINGQRTVIADYDKQEITEIDRAAGTYSITRFAEVASAVAETSITARSKSGPSIKSNEAREWKATPLGLRSAAGRSVDHFEFTGGGEMKLKVDVGIDRSVALTREAVEVLIGAAYPSQVRDEHDPVLRAAAGLGASNRGIASNAVDASADTASYGLPVTQAFTYSESGTELTLRSSITRIGNEAVPADALTIPPGAKRVESKAAAVRRQLRELDHPGSAPAPNQD